MKKHEKELEELMASIVNMTTNIVSTKIERNGLGHSVVHYTIRGSVQNKTQASDFRTNYFKNLQNFPTLDDLVSQHSTFLFECCVNF